MNMNWSLWMNCVALLLFVLTHLLLANDTLGQGGQGDCVFISSSDLQNFISDERFTGDGQEGQEVTLLENNTNCETVGTEKGDYRYLSIAVKYFNPLSIGDEYGRISLRCISSGEASGWNVLHFRRFNEETVGPLLMADTLRNCSSCAGETDTPGFTLDPDEGYECVACSSECNTGGGLGYCIGPGAGDCCNYYDENTCVADCTGNQHPNISNDCVCDEFYQETACTVCILQQSDCLHGGSPNTGTCQCNCDSTGYEGKLCTDDIDECLTANPCDPDQTETCVNKNGTYECVCVNGFDGMNCQNNIDECTSDSCKFGGTCHDGIASFTCTCAPGYTGTICDIDINECETNPCRNGGTCTDRVNDYNCACIDQYEGKSCENDVNECVTLAPCLNEGRCINTDGGYRCECVGKWVNAHCDTCVIDDCVRTNCSGPRYECLECIDTYTPVYPDKAGCVVCTVDNCTSCDREGLCQECAFDLVSNGTVCKPREDRRSVGALDIGSIFGIIIGLGVLIAIVVITIVVVFAISLKIRASKPIQMVVRNPMEKKDPIVLQKHTEL